MGHDTAIRVKEVMVYPRGDTKEWSMYMVETCLTGVMYTRVCVCMCICVFVCACVSVYRERESTSSQGRPAESGRCPHLSFSICLLRQGLTEPEACSWIGRIEANLLSLPSWSRDTQLALWVPGSKPQPSCSQASSLNYRAIPPAIAGMF